MNVFWRKEPLTEPEHQLLTLCIEAHHASANRDNISSVAVCQSAHGSGNYEKSIMAALASIGGTHAPLIETWKMLMTANEVDSTKIVPGWGNSFVKDGPDPLWSKVHDILKAFPVGSVIESVTNSLHLAGKKVYPNPSCYTAATGITLGMPKEILAWIFVTGRLNAWTELFCRSLNLIPK